MNHQYYLICRLFVRPGGQEQLHDIFIPILCSQPKGRPAVLNIRQRKRVITVRIEGQLLKMEIQYAQIKFA